MMNNKNLLIPLFIFLFSFILRFSLISLGPYSSDCLELANQALDTLNTLQIHYFAGLGYPIVVIFGAFFIFIGKIFGVVDPIICVNFMSVVFSSLSISIFYILIKRLFDPLAALISALTLCFFPLFLGVSVYGTSHPISIFFLLSCLLFLLRYFEQKRTPDLIFAACCFGIMGSTRTVEMMTMLPAVIYFIIWRYKLKAQNPAPEFKLSRVIVCFLGMTLTTMLLLHLPLLLTSSENGFASNLASFVYRDLIDHYRGIFSPGYWVGMGYYGKALTPWGCWIAYLGLVWLCREDKRKCLFLILWFLFPFGFFGQLWTAAPRYFILSAIPLIVSFSYLLRYLIQKKGLYAIFSKWVIVATLASMALSIYPILLIRHEKALIIEFSDWIESMTEPNAQIISADDACFIEHYGKRTTCPRPMRYFEISEEELHEFYDRVSGLLRQGIPVYMTRSGLIAYDEGKIFSRFIKKHFRLTPIGSHLSEDWHWGETNLRIGYEELFKLSLH